jgi:hypothetical protein
VLPLPDDPAAVLLLPDGDPKTRVSGPRPPHPEPYTRRPASEASCRSSIRCVIQGTFGVIQGTFGVI